MIKEIVKDKAQLSLPAEPATAEDAQVARDLVDTLASLEEAAALAANQIGSNKAIVVCLDANDNPHVMYNPKMLRGMSPFTTKEACMSIEGENIVKRYARITVTYDELVDGKLVSRKRDFRDWSAELVQHMIDHCNGVLV